MLQQIMDHVHNYFIKVAKVSNYEIADGMISLDFVEEGQRFWITNSVFNDGVYTYHEAGIKNDDDTEAAGLTDERFAGTICALAVPPAVTALSSEINSWVETNGEAVNSPYQSENVIGVYSYTKATGGSGVGGCVSWEDVFKDRLNRWRKIAL
jgi:hypothetical protein